MALPAFLAPLAGAAISGMFGLAGGRMSSEATREANAAAIADKERDRELQREFAQSGIQWRVEDARRAGISPLAALGGSGALYNPSPIAIAPDTGMATAVASMGQDIGRAVNATRTADQRTEAFVKTTQDLQLKRMGLENDLLASQIAKLQSSMNPPMPANAGTTAPVGPIPQGDFEKRPAIMFGGTPWLTDPLTSNASSFEERYGDDGPATWINQAIMLWNDVQKNLRVHPDDPAVKAWRYLRSGGFGRALGRAAMAQGR